MKIHAEKIIVLSIAGSDSIGGAGMQADLLTFAALGVHGCSVITAVTAQNSQMVDSIHVVSTDMIVSQFQAIIDDFPISAVKIGLLGNADVIETISKIIVNINTPIVLDPVLVASSGKALLNNNAIDCLIEKLFPQVVLITPNIPEAEILTQQKISNVADMKTAANILLSYGCKNVLIKGGHLAGANVITDVFVSQLHCFELTHAKLNKQMRGTGCVLSAAISALLAQQHDLITSIRKAIYFVTKAIGDSVGLGRNASHHYLNFSR